MMGSLTTYLISQYEDDLIKMFGLGIKNSSKKMNAGKMRDNLINLYPGRFFDTWRDPDKAVHR